MLDQRIRINEEQWRNRIVENEIIDLYLRSDNIIVELRNRKLQDRTCVSSVIMLDFGGSE